MEVNVENITEIKESHLDSTADIAVSVAIELNFSKNEVFLVQEGAILHDYGKCLIPKEILNKNGPLTPEERKIVDKHADYGYEMLRNADRVLNIKIHPRVLEMIKNHHKVLYRPDNEYENNMTRMTQVLNAADIFSALITKRAYKEAFSKTKALSIMKQLKDEQKLHPKIYDALVRLYSEKQVA